MLLWYTEACLYGKAAGAQAFPHLKRLEGGDDPVGVFVVPRCKTNAARNLCQG